MALGISGSDRSSQMIGSDVAIAYMDGLLGTTADYNISGQFPVSNSLLIKIRNDYNFIEVSAASIWRKFRILLLPFKRTYNPITLKLLKILNKN